MFVVLPVMLSSKLLPEMEMDDNVKREQLLHGMQSLPVAAQIEKLKVVVNSAHSIDTLHGIYLKLYDSHLLSD